VTFLALACAFGCGGSSADEDDDENNGDDTSNGGTSNGGTNNGGTNNGGTSNGGTSNGGTSNGGTSSGGTGGSAGSSGAGSGVPRDKYLDELTPDEQQRLCAWSIAGQGGPGSRACDENTTVTVNTVEECVAGDLSGFHCLVGMVEDCVDSMDGDACALLTSAECAEYIACALDGQN
jgi:hypothetical protein